MHIFCTYLAFVGLFLNLYLAVLALTHSSKAPIYRSFFFMSTVLFLWNFSYFMVEITNFEKSIDLTILQCTVLLIPSATLHYIYSLKKREKRHLFLVIPYLYSIAGCLLFIFTDILFSPWRILIIGFLTIPLGIWGSLVFAKMIKMSYVGVQKKCLKVITAGYLIFILSGILDVSLALSDEMYFFLGIVGSLIFSLTLAWSVFTYHLMDLKRSFKQAFVVFFVLILIYIVYMVISNTFLESVGLKPLVFITLILGLAFFLSPLGPDLLREKIYHIFFTDKIAPVDILNHFIQSEGEHNSSELIISLYLKCLTSALPAQSGSLYMKLKDKPFTLTGYSGSGVPLNIDEKNFKQFIQRINNINGFHEIEKDASNYSKEIFVFSFNKEELKIMLFMTKAYGRNIFTILEKRFLEIITVAFATSINRIEDEEDVKPVQLIAADRFGPIIGNSPPMLELYSTIRKIAPSDSTVMIDGESGSGKDMVAQMIHDLSSRSNASFVAINCGTLTGDLMASELFGHERGSFTGAIARHRGKFEQANGGTLFLDEVGELSHKTQIMLLRAIENREIMRVGGKDVIKVNIRIITATNRNLEQLVKGGSFREDLFYRLNVISIKILPLRERNEDIPLLVDYFIKESSEKYAKKVSGINKQAMNQLMEYDWPGNVRELANTIERAVIVAESEIITSNDLGLNDGFIQKCFSLKDVENEAEREALINALKQTNGNVTHAAKLLGVSRVTLQKKMKKYQLRPLFS